MARNQRGRRVHQPQAHYSNLYPMPNHRHGYPPNEPQNNYFQNYNHPSTSPSNWAFHYAQQTMGSPVFADGNLSFCVPNYPPNGPHNNYFQNHNHPSASSSNWAFHYDQQSMGSPYSVYVDILQGRSLRGINSDGVPYAEMEMFYNCDPSWRPSIFDGVMVLDEFEPRTDDISHEDLSNLEGHSNADVSEETILRNLKIRTHNSSRDQLSEAPSSDEEHEICVVCQAEYEIDEKVGILQCGHEYHVECITKWLQRKNFCPICKATALSVDAI